MIPDLPHGLGQTLPLSGRQGLHQQGLDRKSSKSAPVPRHESESAMMERQAEATCAGPCTRRTRQLSPASHLWLALPLARDSTSLEKVLGSSAAGQQPHHASGGAHHTGLILACKGRKIEHAPSKGR